MNKKKIQSENHSHSQPSPHLRASPFVPKDPIQTIDSKIPSLISLTVAHHLLTKKGWNISVKGSGIG